MSARETHLLFGDEPYLFAIRVRRRDLRATHGSWHRALRTARNLDGTERVLVHCGLLRALSWQPHQLQIVLLTPVTRLRNMATCPACLVAFDRLLESGRAAVKRTPRGPWCHLTFKPTPADIARVVGQTPFELEEQQARESPAPE